MMPDIVLHGCKPEPLMAYLKALGLFRLVSEQADPNATACWREDAFVLGSCLTEEALLHFFLYDYKPTPILGPWGGGSGFFGKDLCAELEA
ncbi:MAG: type I-U CRISPR-associated protein Csx17, partial [Candidatus Omnitrophica bacterium]|nr:type I-U CRISPR-associated protein Csx17 [Candidatus Omnitrophota bacterium]